MSPDSERGDAVEPSPSDGLLQNGVALGVIAAVAFYSVAHALRSWMSTG